MKVLLITEKNTNGIGSSPTPNMVNLIGSLQCCENIVYEHIFISNENDCIRDREQLNSVLLEKHFDFAVVSQCPFGLPSIDVAKKLGKRLVLCWWDTLFPDPPIYNISEDFELSKIAFQNFYEKNNRFGYTLKEYSEFCTNLVFDFGNGEIMKNIYGVAVPQDTRIYYPSDNKTIDISFIGSLRNDRLKFVNALRDKGIKVQTINEFVSFEEYARLIRESNISLNIQMGYNVPQRKGRMFELSACGVLPFVTHPECLSGKNGNLFEENEHFVKVDLSNIVEKTLFYLDDKSKIKTISDNIYEKFKVSYSPLIWWENLVKIVF